MTMLLIAPPNCQLRKKYVMETFDDEHHSRDNGLLHDDVQYPQVLHGSFEEEKLLIGLSLMTMSSSRR
jgi:hypothetical protein